MTKNIYKDSELFKKLKDLNIDFKEVKGKNFVKITDSVYKQLTKE